ncbi:MAG TPA: AraC family transcriptional regulator [Longimicrobiaceae bacterium]|nr:AraC family transcriptional regulator [Longimicrobiaceae bacterium]
MDTSPVRSAEQEALPPSSSAVDESRTSRLIEATGRHAHDTLQVAWVRSGAGVVYQGGEAHAVRAGSLIVIPPGEMHFGRSVGREGWEYTLFNPPPALLAEVGADAELRGDCAQPDFDWVVSEDRAVVEPFALWAQSASWRACALVRESLMHEALAGLLARSVRARGLPRCGPAPRAIRSAVEYLEQRSAEKVALDDLARAARLSKYHLVRAFKREVGLTPHAYHIHLRVARAMRLLRDGRSISAAAFGSAFAAQSHLHSHFRRLLGVTPGEYLREQHS